MFSTSLVIANVTSASCIDVHLMAHTLAYNCTYHPPWCEKKKNANVPHHVS